MRIAYIILAHRLIDQLARLIQTLNDDGADTFFVHLDARADRAGSNLWRTLEQKLNGTVDLRPLRRHRCYWGSLELVLATLEGIRAVVEAGTSYDRVIILSGQDYPIKSHAYIRTFFCAHPSDEFIESFALNSKNPWTHWHGAGSDVSRVWHWHLRFRSRWLHLPLRRRLPLDLVPHGGSQWWALTLPCAQYINGFVTDYPGFIRYYQHAFIPDEQFFQTIVANSRFATHIVGTNLTYTDSSRPAPPWPATLRQQDLLALMQSPKLFARKFDQTQDAAILDSLDQYISNSRHSGSAVSSLLQSMPAAIDVHSGRTSII